MSEKLRVCPPEITEEVTFNCSEFAQIIGITKNTLLLWEQKGRIKPCPQEYRGSRFERVYRVSDIIPALKVLQGIRGNYDFSPHPWIQGVDLDGSFKITTPTGWVIENSINE